MRKLRLRKFTRWSVLAVYTAFASSALTVTAFAGSTSTSLLPASQRIGQLIQQYSSSSAALPNKDANTIFVQDGFSDGLATYPLGAPANGFVWKLGMGTTFKAPYSKITEKAPFTDYFPLPAGPILNPKKTYRIGFVFDGFNQSWLISLADSVAWEASRHPNVKLTVIDAQFDDNRMSDVIDNWVVQHFDGIMVWPPHEAPLGPPVQRAIQAGIPVVTVDRRTSATDVSSEVVGNFYANGLQQGLFLNAVSGGEGNLILNRKALGSTADAVRAGSFLQAIGQKTGYKVLGSYHVEDQRTVAFRMTADALQAHKDITAVYNAGGDEALGALDAILEAHRLNSAPGGKKIVLLADDDQRQVLAAIKAGQIDMDSPYTPFLGDLGLRVLIMQIGAKAGLNKAPPKDVITPNLPMITRTPMVIDGIQTVTPDQWVYAYGPEVKSAK